MKPTWAGALASFLFLLASPLAAQPARELHGQVFHLGENGERILEPGLIVTLVETGATDDANDQGIFRLPLPPAFQPGDSVTFSIDKPGWRIRFPLEGEARIPRDLQRERLPVELLQVGSKLFWTNDRIEKLIRDASERSKQEARREGDAPSLDLGRDIKDWAAKYGFSAEEAHKEIDRWIADVEAAHEDSYQHGLAAFAKQQFDTAAERFLDSAEWRIRQLAETRRQQELLEDRAERLQEEVVRDLRLQGHAHYYAYRFEQALTVYEQSHQYTSKDHAPQLWAATLNDIGLAHFELGRTGHATESPMHFAAAVQAYRQALLVYTREQMPLEWARAQHRLGYALTGQGVRATGSESAQLLAQAVQAYRQVLLVTTYEKMPYEWAAAQHDLSIAIQEQVARMASEEGAQLLAQATQACQQALLVYTYEQHPREWAKLQTTLGIALRLQGMRTAGEEGAQLFAQAVHAHQQALLVFIRQQFPQDWAMTQSNLGNTLSVLGERIAGSEGTQFLAQAVEAHRQTLLVYTREQFPQDWALAQGNLGYALSFLGKRTADNEGAQLLAQSVQAHHQALLVNTRDQLPQVWAITQSNICNALQEQGKRESGETGAALLAQALDACEQALLVLTPDYFPEWWAETRSYEAEALLALHNPEEAVQGLSQILEKVPSYRQAFELLGMALNNRLFHHQEAAALTRSWLSHHPDDLPARLALGEQLFASRAFSDSSQEIGSLLKEPKLSAENRIVALAYAVAAGLAMDFPEVSDRIEELLSVVTAQPQTFKTSWTFQGTLHSLGEAPEVSRKGLLIQLFQAFAAPDRDGLLEGLQAIKESIPARRTP